MKESRRDAGATEETARASKSKSEIPCTVPSGDPRHKKASPRRTGASYIGKGTGKSKMPR